MTRRLAALGLLTMLGTSVIAAPQQSARASTAAPALVVGKVLDSYKSPVAGALVTLTSGLDGTPADHRALSSAEGEFFFTAIPPGRGWLTVEKEGYARSIESVTLAPGERRTDEVARVVKYATVTGRVTDESGAALTTGGYVYALRRTIAGGRVQLDSNYDVQPAAIDDRGEFRMPHVIPGSYALAFRSGRRFTVAVNGEPGRTMSVFYGNVMYPSPAPDGSTRMLTIAAGQDLANINFRVPLLSAPNVSGIVTGASDGRRTTLQLLPDTVDPVERASRTSSYVLRPDGTFRFEGVTAGRYTLRAFAKTEETRDTRAELVLAASVPVTVGTSDVENVSVELRPAARVMGRLLLDGGSPVGELARRHARVDLAFADGRRPDWTGELNVSADGRFTTQGLLPGRYVIRPSFEWYVRSAMLHGRDVSAAPIEIGTENITDLTITLSDRRSVIESAITAGAGILVFPADRRLWSDYGEYSSRMSTCASAHRATTCEIPVPPGEYFIVSTTAPVPPDWTDPANLASLSAGAQMLVLTEGERRRVDVSSAPRR
jgi:phage baseplate assembly protein gpV